MGDDDGFEDWYRYNRPRLARSLIVASGGNVDAAVDSTDEAFVRALERWPRVSRMDSPAAWTYRTALNVLRRRFRRRASEVSAVRALLSADQQGNRGHESTLDRLVVWEAVEELGERERTAMALRYVGGLSEAEVGTAMGLTEGGASALLSRARKALRRTLSDEEVRVV
ncbi:MAG: RNA polymerase sigma factor [Microthrixaceae bacterium]